MKEMDLKSLTDSALNSSAVSPEIKSLLSSLMKTVNNLEVTLKEKEGKVGTLAAQVVDLKEQVEYLKEIAKGRGYELFMSKSEKRMPEGYTQPTFYDVINDLELSKAMVEAQKNLDKAEEEQAKAKGGEKAVRKSRNFINRPDALPKDLPVTIKDITFSEEEISKEHLKDIHCDQVRRFVHRTPAHYEIYEIHVHQYQKETEDGLSVIVRPEDKTNICSPKSTIDNSVVADIITNKYMLGLPLYRQQRNLESQQIMLSRMTMVNGLTRAYQAISPVCDLIKDFIRKAEVIHADETPDPVIELYQKDGKGAMRPRKTKTYVWGFGTSERGFHPSIYYQLGPTRSAEVPLDFLKGCTRKIIQTDGYSPYHSIPNTTNAGCLAHVRRKFYSAQMTGRKDYAPYASNVIRIIGLIYGQESLIEKECGTDYKAVKAKRAEKLKPLFDDLDKYIDSISAKVEKSSTLRRAIDYYQNQ